jgi:hypothetical protein
MGSPGLRRNALRKAPDRKLGQHAGTRVPEIWQCLCTWRQDQHEYIANSFLLAYPAYLGVVGLVLSLLAVIITDIIVSVLLLRVPNALYPIGVGLAAVISFNFILSDFRDVMLSHGGAMAIALMAFFAVTRDGHVLRNAVDLLKITRKPQD